MLTILNRNNSDGTYKRDKVLGQTKKIHKNKIVSQDKIKQNFLMRIRENNSIDSEKTIEDYENRLQLGKH